MLLQEKDEEEMVESHLAFVTEPFIFRDEYLIAGLDLETLTSCHHIQHITLHKTFLFLAVTNLKYKNYTNFYNLFLLLSKDVSLNPGPI